MQYGDSKQFTVRDSAILTGSYVAGTVINLAEGGFNQLVINPQFTIGSLTSASIKVEFSKDGTTYQQETYEEPTLGTGTITAYPAVHVLGSTYNPRIAIPILPGEQYIKISALGTGTATDSLLAINATVANV
jgi:hypothetical protein